MSEPNLSLFRDAAKAGVHRVIHVHPFHEHWRADVYEIADGAAWLTSVFLGAWHEALEVVAKQLVKPSLDALGAPGGREKVDAACNVALGIFDQLEPARGGYVLMSAAGPKFVAERTKSGTYALNGEVPS